MTIQLFRHTIWIDCPREKVFDFFLDFSQAARWRSSVRSMEAMDPLPLGPGSRVRVTMDVLGNQYTYILNVLECDRPSLWRHHTDESDFRGHVEYTFEPEITGTRVSMSMRVKPVTFYGWIGLPLMLLRRGKAYREQLPQLKRALEGRSPD
jgi:hypothetical protein